ncbi:TIGR01440 family protein [Tepidanaerobacter sp. GT38]|uniref:TIGR01440 family protein n=1 Tax=Tepidanaerobacter sp. GT38 TaxID=2722793 RepID=UPI001F2BC675|nr:TIGR01440 family protein [Tepidanaerobacter sp. GT38]MCG1011842.1 TIGR01440 family protein [Tepidanaerobacter sp. GT38]
MDLQLIENEVSKATEELLSIAPVKAGQILVVGCSTSEIMGGRIGKSSSMEVAEAVVRGIYKVIPKYKVNLAAQCCEHLNRALVVEEEVAEKYNLEIVSVVPVMHAGGAFATAVRENMKNPVVVEFIKGHFGLDIGDTLIGMHIKHVAVPVRLSIDKIGQAHLTAARYRPKLIGGARAVAAECFEKVRS